MNFDVLTIRLRIKKGTATTAAPPINTLETSIQQCRLYLVINFNLIFLVLSFDKLADLLNHVNWNIAV
jgi:hypothetical protein